MSRTNFKELLQSGVHFGHLKKKYNPAMAPYVFMEQNGIPVSYTHLRAHETREERLSRHRYL